MAIVAIACCLRVPRVPGRRRSTSTIAGGFCRSTGASNVITDNASPAIATLPGCRRETRQTPYKPFSSSTPRPDPNDACLKMACQGEDRGSAMQRAGGAVWPCRRSEKRRGE